MTQDDKIQNPGSEITKVNQDLGIKADHVFAGRIDVSSLMLREQEKQRADDEHGEGRGKE